MKFLKGAKSWLSYLLAASFAIPLLLSITGVISIRAVLSDSMAPKINVGDVVVGANWITPTLDEVAMYRQRDVSGNVVQDVVHRVITISEQGQYQFKGDNNSAMDPLPVPKSDIVSTIFLKIPYVGSLLNPLGVLSVTMFIGGLYIVYFGSKAVRKPRSEEQ